MGKNSTYKKENSLCFAIGNYDGIIRVCKENETPGDFMIYIVLPITLFLFLLSVIASVWLQHLGDDLELYIWVGILSHSVIKDLMTAKFHILNLIFLSGKSRRQNEFEYYLLSYDIVLNKDEKLKKRKEQGEKMEEKYKNTKANKEEMIKIQSKLRKLKAIGEKEADKILMDLIDEANLDILNCQDRLTGFSCLDLAFCIHNFDLLFKMIERGGYFKKTFVDDRLTLSFPKGVHSKTFRTYEGSKIVIMRTRKETRRIKRKEINPINWCIRLNGKQFGSNDGEDLIEVAMNLRKFKKPVQLQGKTGTIYIRPTTRKYVEERIAQIEVKTSKGNVNIWYKTPLEKCLSSFHNNWIRFLIFLGVTFESSNQDGQTPWEYFFQKYENQLEKIDAEFTKMAFLNNAGSYIKAEEWLILKHMVQLVKPHAHCKLTTWHDSKRINVNTDSALHFVAAYGCMDCLELFLGMKMDVNSINSKNQTPLHLACKYQHLKIVKTLLENGANPNFEDNENNTTLYIAICAGNVDIVKLLLSYGADVNNGENSKIPIHRAIEQNMIEILSELIKNGADVNAESLDQFTPLVRAVMKGHLQCAEILIDHNSNLEQKVESSQTLLHLVAKHGKVDTSSFLTTLINHRIDVNAEDVNANTPLHLAKSSDTVQILIANGANVKAKNNKNETAMHVFTKKHHNNANKSIESLINAGADVNVIDEKGITPLFYASDPKSKAILIKNGSKAIVQTKKNRLHELMLYHGRDITLTKTYIEEGDDVNCKDDKGNTPLYYAKNIYNVMLLIKKGANVNEKNNKGRVALHQAVNLWQWKKRKLMQPTQLANLESIIKFLIENGADVNLTDCDGETPLQSVDKDLQSELKKIMIEAGATQIDS